MDAGVIVAIVVGVLILVALFALLGRKSRDRKLEANRHEAREIRREAEVSRAQADKTRAEADAQAAEARRQDALARERAAEADVQQREAHERHREADDLDPDVDGVTAHGYGENGDRTRRRACRALRAHRSGRPERERRFERDADDACATRSASSRPARADDFLRSSGRVERRTREGPAARRAPLLRLRSLRCR